MRFIRSTREPKFRAKGMVVQQGMRCWRGRYESMNILMKQFLFRNIPDLNVAQAHLDTVLFWGKKNVLIFPI